MIETESLEAVGKLGNRIRVGDYVTFNGRKYKLDEDSFRKLISYHTDTENTISGGMRGRTNGRAEPEGVNKDTFMPCYLSAYFKVTLIRIDDSSVNGIIALTCVLSEA